jgi:hypothetical protein
MSGWALAYWVLVALLVFELIKPAASWGQRRLYSWLRAARSFIGTTLHVGELPLRAGVSESRALPPRTHCLLVFPAWVFLHQQGIGNHILRGTQVRASNRAGEEDT